MTGSLSFVPPNRHNLADSSTIDSRTCGRRGKLDEQEVALRGLELTFACVRLEKSEPAARHDEGPGRGPGGHVRRP